MTRVTFYFNANDKAEVAMRLAGKAYGAGKSVLVYEPDAVRADALDRLFWTASQLSFLPHVRCGHPLANQTPILIGDKPEELAQADVIINLGQETPACFARFERLLEVVGRDEADRERGRAAFRFLRERGYALDTHDLSASGG